MTGTIFGGNNKHREKNMNVQLDSAQHGLYMFALIVVFPGLRLVCTHLEMHSEAQQAGTQ